MAVAHRIYAEALFSAAKEQGALPQVHEELGDFVAAVHETPELRGLLRNPQLDSRTKQAILTDLVGDAHELVRSFLLLTAEKGRIGEVEAIGAEFERLMAREERRLNVELTTAKELSDEEAGRITRQIEQASGRKVEASRRVDPTLIGGMVLRVGTLEVDASVRGRLERLRHELLRS